MRCKETNRHGEPCQAPESLVDEGTGLCRAHRPGGRELLLRQAEKGGRVTRRRLHGSGVTAEDLGPLQTHDDAKRWLETIGTAVCGGSLSERAAQAAIRAVEAWLKAEADATTAAMYDELKREIETLKSEAGNRGRPLEAVR